MKSLLLRIGGTLAACAVGVIVWRSYLQRATAERIRIASPAGIASLEKVRLGGVEQWIQIRGHDRAKPILLFLHSVPRLRESGLPRPPGSLRWRRSGSAALSSGFKFGGTTAQNQSCFFSIAGRAFRRCRFRT